MKIVLYIILISISFFFSLGSKAFLRKQKETAEIINYEPTYLPKAKYLKTVSLGFNNFLSDIIWFKTVSYFGEEFKKNKNYRYLDLMCNLTTDLDPKDRIRFENCSTLLSWVVKDPVASNKLLDKGIKSEPDYWRYHYAKGFNNWYFLEEMEKAKNNMLKAAKSPNAPNFLNGLASRLIAKTSNPKDALIFLKNQYDLSSSKEAKTALLDKIKRAELSYHLFELDKAAQNFKESFGREASSFQEIVDNKLLRFLPKEPFGGTYILEKGKAKHTSGEKPLKFFGKTAKSGAMKGEFKNFNLNNSEESK